MPVSSLKKKAPQVSSATKSFQSSRSAEFVHSSDDSSYEKAASQKSSTKHSARSKSIEKRPSKPSPKLLQTVNGAPEKPSASTSQRPVRSLENATGKTSKSQPNSNLNKASFNKLKHDSSHVNGDEVSLDGSRDSSESREDSGRVSSSGSEDEEEDHDHSKTLPLEKRDIQALNDRKAREKAQTNGLPTPNPLKRKRPSPSTSSSRTPSTSPEESVTSGTEDDSGNGAVKRPDKPPRSVSSSSQQGELSAPPSVPYKPPPGSEVARIPDESSSILDAFEPASLQGKQVWQISIPASIPVETITTVPLDSMTDGSPILTHDGIQYTLSLLREGASQSEMILLPDVEKNMYLPLKGAKITRSLRVQEVPRTTGPRPREDEEIMDVEDDEGFANKHKQPKGMKMRYRPFGDYDSDSDDDERMQDVQATRAEFRKPNVPITKGHFMNMEPSPGQSADQAGRRTSDTSDATPGRKDKTLRSPPKNQPKPVAGDDVNMPGETLHAKKARKKHGKSERDIFEIASDVGSSQPPTSQTTSSTHTRKETPEEKAQRREERRRRKADQAQMSDAVGDI